MVARKQKSFVLVDWDPPHRLVKGKQAGTTLTGKGEHVFRSIQARGAALKAANKGVNEIALKEKGSKYGTIHFFKGSRRRIKVDEKTMVVPDWIKDRGFIYEAKVKKGKYNGKDLVCLTKRTKK